MSSSNEAGSVLQEALLGIQSRLVEEEGTRLNSMPRNGKQPATLLELRKTQLYEAKVNTLEELLSTFTHIRVTEDRRSERSNRFNYREFNSRVSPKIALGCIIGEKPQEPQEGRNQRHQKPRPTGADQMLAKTTPHPHLHYQVQASDRAASARRAQLQWQEEAQKNANRRREESYRNLERIREVRNSVREMSNNVIAERRAQAAVVAAARLEAETEARRAGEVECAVCLESSAKANAAQLPCTHWYCVGHLTQAFETALSDKRPFRCCNEPVPVDILAETSSPLGRDFMERYILLILEQSTPNPVYCWVQTCSGFIPPVMSRGPDEMDCPACGATTCRHCRGEGHAGRDCVEDVQTRRLLRLASRRGWRRCPRCQAMIERNGGCSTMTCRCNGVFTM